MNDHCTRTLKIISKGRLKTYISLYYSALDGLGIANLPYLTVEADIASGRLIHILPDWCSNIGSVQLVYASRKGQRLVMEKLIEHLIQGLRDFASTSKGYHL